MVTHEDTLPSFIPKNEVQFIILGTMVAINARTIDGEKPPAPFFYYNNSRNHFWRVLQYLMNPHFKTKEDIQGLNIQQKKSFLNFHGIAICNLVQKVVVPNKYREDHGRMTFRDFLLCCFLPGLVKLPLGLHGDPKFSTDTKDFFEVKSKGRRNTSFIVADFRDFPLGTTNFFS